MHQFLCIETATDVCSVAIGDGNGSLFLEETDRKNSHTETITLFVKSCMEKAGLGFNDLSAIGISQGPGSYTGLRVGTSVAKALAYAHDLPMVAIDTLYGLAMAWQGKLKEAEVIVPMIDARRMEVYYAVYDHDLNPLQPTDNLIIQDYVMDEMPGESKIVVCGDGAWKTKDVKTNRKLQIEESRCSAEHLIVPCREAFIVKNFVDTAYFSPFYFKSPNITKPGKKPAAR